MALLGFAIALQSEGCDEFGSTFWKSYQPNAEIVLLKFHRRVAAMHCHRADFVQQVANYNRFTGPIMNMRVERVALARVAQIVPATWLAVIRKTNRITVLAIQSPTVVSTCTDSSGIEPSSVGPIFKR